MIGGAEPGKFRMELRASGGHSLVPADHNVGGQGVHQPLREDATCPGASGRYGWAGSGGSRSVSKLADKGARASCCAVRRSELGRIGTAVAGEPNSPCRLGDC